MVSQEYMNAYSEVLEILQHISLEEFNKIPKEMIDTFKKNANTEYRFEYNPNKTLKQQNVSKKARYIIAILFRDYWATPFQKERIEEMEKYDLQKRENQKTKKYNPDNIFKNKQIQDEQVLGTHTELVEYKKQKWHQKLFIKILRLLKKD